jgi:hypothetical protein
VAVSTATTAEPGQILLANLVGFAVWASVLTLLATSGGSELQPHAPGVFLFNVFSDAAADALVSVPDIPTVPTVPSAPPAVAPGR